MMRSFENLDSRVRGNDDPMFHRSHVFSLLSSVPE